MNGSSNIYRLKPLYQIPKNIDLPDCMYKLKNPVAQVTNATKTEKSSQNFFNNIMDKVDSATKESLPELSELEVKWDTIIKQLLQLKSQLADIRKTVSLTCKLTGYSLVDTVTLNNLKPVQGAVINANPTNPPYSLLLLRNLYKSSVPINIKTHIHSNLSSFPEHLKIFGDSKDDDSNKSLNIHLIWKNDILDTEIVMNPVKQLPIKGEVNILKILASCGLTLLQYPSEDILKTTQMDNILDLCHRLVHSSASKERTFLCKSLNGKIGRQPYFGGENFNIVDVSAWSTIKQVFDNVKGDLSPNILKWYEKMNKL